MTQIVLYYSDHLDEMTEMVITPNGIILQFSMDMYNVMQIKVILDFFFY